MKRYKVVQDARGYWGIWDREDDDFASWGYLGDSGAEYVYSIFVTSSMLNSGQIATEGFYWGEYLPRENA